MQKLISNVCVGVHAYKLIAPPSNYIGASKLNSENLIILQLWLCSKLKLLASIACYHVPGIDCLTQFTNPKCPVRAKDPAVLMPTAIFELVICMSTALGLPITPSSAEWASNNHCGASFSKSGKSSDISAKLRLRLRIWANVKQLNKHKCVCNIAI